jgi:peptidoglycan/xylan/chitin deacetylase (PgdA/CDA1 family)
VFLVGYDLLYAAPLFIYIILFLLYSFVLFYGCYYIASNFFIPVICSANTDKEQIAISFDDGPSKAYTAEILQILKDNNIEAAFFCIGKNIPGNEIILKQIHNEGHIIGNHSFSHHFLFDLFSAKKMCKDLARLDEMIESLIGLKPKLFRPPYGVINPMVRNAIIKSRYIPISWNVRSLDTVIKNEQKLLNKVNQSLKPGAIFLFHDTSKTTLTILSAFIQHVKESGYEIVRLDKMLNLKAYV